MIKQILATGIGLALVASTNHFDSEPERKESIRIEHHAELGPAASIEPRELDLVKPTVSDAFISATSTTPVTLSEPPTTWRGEFDSYVAADIKTIFTQNLTNSGLRLVHPTEQTNLREEEFIVAPIEKMHQVECASTVGIELSSDGKVDLEPAIIGATDAVLDSKKRDQEAISVELEDGSYVRKVPLIHWELVDLTEPGANPSEPAEVIRIQQKLGEQVIKSCDRFRQTFPNL